MEEMTQHPARVAIVGAGNVGATCAYALMLDGAAAEIVLIDRQDALAEGQAMDLNHAMPFAHPARVWAGDYSDCAGADIVIITAGAAQRPGETRLELTQRNAQIFRQIVPRIVEQTQQAILLVATNPLDAMTYQAWKLSGLPASRVFGSGTILDSARFRYLLSQRFGVESRSVHAFIIGEHGDSQVAVWSLANIAGIRLDDYCRLNHCAVDEDTRAAVAQDVRESAYEIIRRKGATYYAIGAGLARIVQAVLHNENSVLTVSSLLQGMYGLDEVCLSLPAVINRQGVARVLELPLNAAEQTALEKSARIIQEAIASIR